MYLMLYIKYYFYKNLMNMTLIKGTLLLSVFVFFFKQLFFKFIFHVQNKS